MTPRPCLSGPKPQVPFSPREWVIVVVVVASGVRRLVRPGSCLFLPTVSGSDYPRGKDHGDLVLVSLLGRQTRLWGPSSETTSLRGGSNSEVGSDVAVHLDPRCPKPRTYTDLPGVV